MVTTEKIDMVYLWCDGNEPAFKERKNKFVKHVTVSDKQAGEARYFDNDELKYSLRSLEMYAPWINHVYIVTDRQIPKWLNIAYEKVTVVDHSEIMPQEIIPVFNSVVIEYFLPFIPNLSEKFIYGNDDMFFGNKVEPDYFFHNEKPIVRLKKSYSLPFKNDHISKSVRTSLNLLNKTYNKLDYYRLHHNIDAYSKSAFMTTLNRYKEEFTKTYSNKFRAANDIHRIIFGLDAVYSGKAELELVQLPKFWERYFLILFKTIKWDNFKGREGSRSRKQILKFKPTLFCINAAPDSSEESKRKSKLFFEQLFPYPSKFEI